MTIIPRKWLILLVTTLLLHTSLAQAVSALEMSPDARAALEQHAPMNGHPMHPVDASTPAPCDNCQGATACTGDSCACQHCGSCATAILPGIPPLPGQTAGASVTPLIVNNPSNQPFLLFRPPRA